MPAVTEPAPDFSMAVVQSIEVQVRENSPIQVNAIVRGQLADSGCTTISSIDQTRDGNTFHLSLTTTTDPLALCAAARTPFERVVALDVSNLPSARYIVNANSIESTFDLVLNVTYALQQKRVCKDAFFALLYNFHKDCHRSRQPGGMRRPTKFSYPIPANPSKGIYKPDFRSPQDFGSLALHRLVNQLGQIPTKNLTGLTSSLDKQGAGMDESASPSASP